MEITDFSRQYSQALLLGRPTEAMKYLLLHINLSLLSADHRQIISFSTEVRRKNVKFM